MSYHLIQIGTWPAYTPTKDQFESSDLDTHTVRWEFRREPGESGRNEAQDFNVPEGRVLVGWEANETSCIRCEGIAYQLVKDENVLPTPIGIRPGARLEPGGFGGPGASFTGVLTLISVPYSVWLPVQIPMIPQRPR